MKFIVPLPCTGPENTFAPEEMKLAARELLRTAHQMIRWSNQTITDADKAAAPERIASAHIMAKAAFRLLSTIAEVKP